MSEVRAIALSLLALFGAFAVVAPASLALPAGSVPGGGDAPLASDPTVTDESSLGEQVSTFMHASAGQTSESVEAGMWDAAVASAVDKPALVDSRADDIANRIDELGERKGELLEARRDGEISEAEYRARMSAIVGRMAALNQSIDATERLARTTGANVTRVQRLREQASNVSGPEVSAVARTMAGGPPEGVPGQGGPPDERGRDDDVTGPPNGTNGAGNEGQGPPGNGKGPGNGGNGQNGGNGDGGPAKAPMHVAAVH